MVRVQETPAGETPASAVVFAYDDLVDAVRPGDRVGEMDVRRGQDGNPVVGGRPTSKEQAVRSEGLSVRQKLKDFMQRQRCERPSSNWFRQNNRVLDNNCS